MRLESVVVLLFVAATAVAIVARRVRLPYTVALVVAGLVLGGLHALEPPHLTQRLLFTVFLPGLIFEAAFHLDLASFRRDAAAIVSLALPGVLAGMLLTAVILQPAATVLELAQAVTWHHALVFGALMAATDPIAVVGLFRSVGAPRRLAMLLEAESLLNDGTSIVLFGLVLGYGVAAVRLRSRSWTRSAASTRRAWPRRRRTSARFTRSGRISGRTNCGSRAGICS